MAETGPLDITVCEREPVHIPGRVQPHGVLLVLSESDMTVLQASANAEEMLCRPLASLIGRPLEDFLDAGAVERVRRAFHGKGAATIPLRLFTVEVQGCETTFDATGHCSGELLILELEPKLVQKAPDHPDAPDLNYILKTSFPRLQRADSLTSFCQVAAEVVRRITSFDRVMIYRFDAEWNGEVIAEDVRSDWEPYLGLRYPASDIPRQARELYLKNALRLIADVHGAPVPLVPAQTPSTNAPLDMTHAVLRAVSPVHIEYLQNMGVGASMSIAILKQGALWGLIACHHSTARYVPYELRSGCEILGQMVSLLIPEKEATGEHGYTVALKSAQAALVSAISSTGDVLRGLADATPNVADYVQADGAAILLEGRCILLGQTPDEDAVRRLAAWLSRRVTGEVYATHALPREYPDAAEWADAGCGLLAVPLSRVSHSFVLWFRPELVHTVNWGGDPNKRVEVSEGTARISPRKSFASWQQLVRGESQPWKSVEINAARDLRQSILGMFVHLAEVRRQEEERHAAYERERLIAETLQRALLSDLPEGDFPGLTLAALYEAAWSEANIGGDFYDALPLPDGRVALVVGDVVGKGLAAAQHIMEAKFTLRAFLLAQNAHSGDCLTRLNAVLYRAHGGDASSLIALALVIVDPVAGEIQFASAGAEYPLLVSAETTRSLISSGPVLGASPDIQYRSGTERMDAGETLMMLTDGITESRQKNVFLDSEGAVTLLQSVPPRSSLRITAQKILSGAKAFSGGTFRDDACVLLARRLHG